MLDARLAIHVLLLVALGSLASPFALAASPDTKAVAAVMSADGQTGDDTKDGYVDPRRWGAHFNGTDDDAPALNAAFAQGGPVRFPPNRVARIGSTLTFDISKVALSCNGTIIDASAMKRGAAIRLFSSIRDTQTMGMIHNAHPMTDCLLWGPTAGAGVNGIEFAPSMIAGGIPYITGIEIDRLGATGFDNLFVLDAGIVALKLENISYLNRGRFKPGTFIRVLGGRNSGERIVVSDSFVAGASDFIVDANGNPNTDIYVANTSIDATARIVTGGDVPGSAGAHLQVFFEGGHWEAQRGTDYILNSDGGAIIVSGLSWTLPKGDYHTPCRTTGIASAPGVLLRDVVLNGVGQKGPYFCDGWGRFVAINTSGLGNTSAPLFAWSNNLVPDFLFATSAPLKPWKLTDDAVLDRKAPPGEAKGALVLMAGPGQSATASIKGVCEPGRMASAQALVRWEGKDAVGAPAMSLFFTDVTGQDVLGAITRRIEPARSGSYRLERLVTARAAAPPGTGLVGLRFDIAPGRNGKLSVAEPMLVCQ